MTKQSAPELFTQRPVRSDFGRQQGSMINMRHLLVVIVLVGLAVGVGVALNKWQHKEEAIASGDVPTIKAEEELMKKPDEPGGLDVPHQDVTVFQQLEKKQPVAADGSVEHLLPPPETPQPVAAQPAPVVTAQTPPPAAPSEDSAMAAPQEDDLPPPITADEPPVKTTEKLIENAKPVVSSVAKPVAQAVKSEAVKAAADEAKPVKIEEISPVLTTQEVKAKVEASADETKKAVKTTVADKKAVVKEAAVAKVSKAKEQAVKTEDTAARLPEELFTTGIVPTKTAAATVPTSKKLAEEAAGVPASSSGKKVRVQFASLPDQAAAQAALKKIKATHGAALGGLSLELVRADLGSKGVYYRVMSNSVAEPTARKICADLQKQKAACFIAR